SFRNLRRGGGMGDIGDELVGAVQAGEFAQKVPDIDFVAGEVTAYRVCVDRKAHLSNLSISREGAEQRRRARGGVSRNTPAVPGVVLAPAALSFKSFAALLSIRDPGQ